MADTIANAIVELGKLAVIAYAIHQAQPVCLRWIERMPVQPSDEQIIDAARKAGLEVRA